MTWLRRKTGLELGKLAVIILVGVVLYSEFFCYFSAFNGWPGAVPGKKILLVADPQLQGFNGEVGFPVGTITRWDSDRYLRKNYAWARSAYDIKAVIFLGDLLDEGFEATDEEYATYTDRFYSIYPLKSDDEFVFISGDNDVGGEKSEVSKEAVNRFNAHFPQTNYKVLKIVPEVEVVNVNVLEMRVKPDMWEWMKKLPAKRPDRIRIVLSHISLSPPAQNSIASKLLESVKPDVILSAHYHRGIHVTTSLATASSQESKSKASFFKQASGEQPIVMDFGNSNFSLLHEIVVPTCSYRMGETEMAFGLLSLNPESMTLTYTNLWLPKRFAMLFLYLTAVVLALVLACLARCCRNASPNLSTKRVPLLS